MSNNNTNMHIVKEKLIQLIIINKEILIGNSSLSEISVNDLISQLNINEIVNLINKVFIIKKLFLISKEIDSHEQEILNFLSDFLSNFVSTDGFYSISNRTTDVSKV